jgi:hypothetical protein
LITSTPDLTIGLQIGATTIHWGSFVKDSNNQPSGRRQGTATIPQLNQRARLITSTPDLTIGLQIGATTIHCGSFVEYSNNQPRRRRLTTGASTNELTRTFDYEHPGSDDRATNRRNDNPLRFLRQILQQSTKPKKTNHGVRASTNELTRTFDYEHPGSDDRATNRRYDNPLGFLRRILQQSTKRMRTRSK